MLTRLSNALPLAVILLLPSVALAADRVTLTNGDTLTGRVRGGSGSDISFESELAGRVTIKWSAVRNLMSDTALRIERANGDVVQGLLSVDGGRLTIVRSDGTRVGLTGSDIRTIGDEGATWRGSIDGDLALSRGNTDTATVALNTAATRVSARQKLGTYATYIFSNVGVGADRATLARTARGGARLDRDVAGNLYAFGFGDIENDPIQLLDLRTVAGGGGGAHLVNTGRSQLNVFGGVSFARDRYTEIVAEPSTAGTTSPTTPTTTAPPGNSGAAPGRTISAGRGRTITVGNRTPPAVVNPTLTRDVGEFVAGQDLWAQLSDRFSLTERLTFFPAIGDINDYRISFDMTLFAQLTDRWQWHISASDRYLRIPPSGGAVRNDLFISSGIGLSFGNGSGATYSGADTRPR